MKKIQITLLTFALFITISCDDYLDTSPFSFVTLDNFYKTPADAEMALTGVYNILSANTVGQGFGNNATYSRNLMVMLNGATDEALVRDLNVNPDYTVWGNGTFTAQSNFVNESWVFFYAGIVRANYLIERIENIEGFSGVRKNEIIAEARLLRGFYHMMLSMMHGGIPVNYSSEENAYKPRNSIQEVYELVLSDYEFAYQVLPHQANMPGRANKWTAAGLLAKAHTYLASAKLSGVNGYLDINSFDWVNSSQHYQIAVGYTQDIIDQSGYILTARYDYLFRETTKQAQYEEFLFAAEASNNSTSNVINIISNCFTPQGNVNLTGGGFGWYRPTHELFQMYRPTGDIRRNHNCSGNIQPTASVETIEGARYFVPRTVPNSGVAFYCIGKYRMIDPAQKTLPNWASNINLPILRYADVLLMHAEALFYTGNEPAARQMFTQIRTRALAAGTNIDQLNTTYQRPNFVDELLEERARELCFENWRRIDLVRFNRLDQTVNNMSTTSGFYNIINVPVMKGNWRPERIWLPIPTIQLDINQNLIQNPGYTAN
ncbi:MAG: RagB/SusD family nutrient uptake outer membrane protein [Flavobacterium sp.]